MRIINKKYLLIILLIGGILTGVIIFKPKENIKLDNVILKQEVNNKTMAMYVGKDNNYEEYNGTTFPKGYRLNTLMSKCIDNNGEEIKDALQEDNGNITLTTNKSSYCYLYFDEKENLSNICNESTMEDCLTTNKEKITTIENVSDLTSELYRYHGLEVDNYICFGTNDKEQCLSEQDKYLYRIIGINEAGNLKLIKNTSIGKMQWNDKNSVEDCGSNVENCTWEKSTLKKYLNTEFLNNEKYISSDLQDKISAMNWNIGLIFKYSDQPYAEKIYEKESGTQTVDKLKIGLMYMSDYYYAYDKGEGITNCDLLPCDSWLYSSKEWTMTYLGLSYSNTSAESGVIYPDYSIGSNSLTNVLPIRPVFYLTNTIKVTGLGTIDNPYLISN